MTVMQQSLKQHSLRAVLALLALAGVPAVAADKAAEPNTQVPLGSTHYVADGFPDRIVATPAQDAARGFAVAWRTDASVTAPWLELVVAGDSPDVGTPRRIQATTATLNSENGASHHHRADIDGLTPDTLYAYRVQGHGTWGAWNHFRTAATPDTPLTLLYFGDTQNKNLSLVSRVIRQAWRSAPEARLALFAGDLVSGKDGQDDNEWAEWFEAGRWLLEGTAVAPAPGNHEYHEEAEDTPQATRTLGGHWPVTFALPRNGPARHRAHQLLVRLPGRAHRSARRHLGAGSGHRAGTGAVAGWRACRQPASLVDRADPSAVLFAACRPREPKAGRAGVAGDPPP